MATATSYAARRDARHAARWTLSDNRVHAAEARKQMVEARGLAKIAAELSELPKNPTERDAKVYLLADRALSDWCEKYRVLRQRRLDLIHQRRQARATLASIRWTAADQRRREREEEEAYLAADARAAAWFEEAAYGSPD